MLSVLETPAMLDQPENQKSLTQIPNPETRQPAPQKPNLYGAKNKRRQNDISRKSPELPQL